MKSSPAPIPIHLNERVTHFSALVPIECEATGRQMRDATKNAKERCCNIISYILD